MKKLRNPCFVPRLALALAACMSVVGIAHSAEQADAQIQALCGEPAKPRSGVITVETQLGSTPALMRFPPTISRPPIILWHGFGPPASERALMDALPLDDVPAIKIYLGLPQFGAREAPGGREDMVRRQTQDLGRLVFKPVVVGAANELPAVITALRQHKCVERDDTVSLFGFSAGGASVLFALAEKKAPIGAAVIVNASTGLTASVQAYERATKQQYTWSEHSRDLARRTDAIQRAADIARGHPALLIVHGKDDAMLSSQSVIALRDALAPFYKSAADEPRLRLELVEGLSHGWADSAHVGDLRHSVAGWFNGQS